MQQRGCARALSSSVCRAAATAMVCVSVVFIVACVAAAHAVSADATHTNTWAVMLRAVPASSVGPAAERRSAATTEQQEEEERRALDAVAASVARAHGLISLGRIGRVRGAYLFAPADSQTARTGVHVRHPRNDSMAGRLAAHPAVRWAEQQRILRRLRRGSSVSASGDDTTLDVVRFSDPLWPAQWHLHNRPTAARLDVNVVPAWREGITGRGVIVSILDDGLEHTHPDLRDNYRPEASWDFNDNDRDPMPRYESTNINRHGTRCAGEVAASPGNVCGVGVAFRAGIGGVRMLDGDVTDATEAHSLTFALSTIDIYSCSWGPDDNGRTVEGPGLLAEAALEEGVAKGRNGKGAIYVFANGNGGAYGDNCNCDGYTNSIYTISIGSVDEHGKKPWYSELCAATMAVTFSSGGRDVRAITSTDFRGACTNSHTGTSAAAPLAAGIFALVLEANSTLSWRDVQHLVVQTAGLIDPGDADWVRNGAGLHVNHKYGFGVLDAALLVAVARVWPGVPEKRVCTMPDWVERQAIPDGSEAGAVMMHTVTACSGTDAAVEVLEHVQVVLTLTHADRGDLAIVLISPAGTESALLTPRQFDTSGDGFHDWTFMSVRHWGESPVGMWKLVVKDVRNNGKAGELVSWRLLLHGTVSHDYWSGTGVRACRMQRDRPVPAAHRGAAA